MAVKVEYSVAIYHRGDVYSRIIEPTKEKAQKTREVLLKDFSGPDGEVVLETRTIEDWHAVE